MFAVIKTGGKQYRVAPGDVISIEKLPEDAGATVRFDHVLMHGNGAGVTVGTPYVDGAVVTGEILEQYRGAKVTGLKKRRRKHSSARRWGHRQYLTRVRIAGIPGDEDGSAAAKADESAPAASAPAVDAVAAVAGISNAVSGPVDDADDLTKLPGVSEAVRDALNGMGIYRFSQITEWGPEDWDAVEAGLDTALEGDASLSRASVLSQAQHLIERRSAASEEASDA